MSRFILTNFILQIKYTKIYIKFQIPLQNINKIFILYKNHLKMKNKLTSPNLFSDVCDIIEQGRQQAYAAVNKSMIEIYWNIGKRIVEEEQSGKNVLNMAKRLSTISQHS